MGIAVDVRSLGMDKGDVRFQRRNDGDWSIAIGTIYEADLSVGRRHITAQIAAQGEEREIGRAGHVAADHAKMGIFFDCQRSGDAVLYGAADAMQNAYAGVAQIAEYQLGGDARGDHLIVYQIGCQSAEHQVMFALANDLMGGGEANESGETFDGDGAAVGHIVGDGLPHGDKFSGSGHDSPSTRIR